MPTYASIYSYLKRIKEIKTKGLLTDLIDLLIADDLDNIFHKPDPSFVYDILLGEYWTPYSKLTPDEILDELNSRNFTQSEQDFTQFVRYNDYADVNLEKLYELLIKNFNDQQPRSTNQALTEQYAPTK